ncbi:MAG TPA: ABC transporter substrate-binding protein [Planctomycetota bacterium]|nr:ABC transporter substrate-binding protein [Planctomycetota bacterium]
MKWLPAVLLLLAPQEASTLRAAWGTVRTVDPALAVDPQDVRVADLLFDGLGGAEAKVEGAVVTFKLPDRKWSDGRPVTAADYRFAWRRCLDPSLGSPWAFRFRHIKNALAWHEAEAVSARLLLYENEGPAGRAEVIALAARVATTRHLTMFRDALEVEKDEKLAKALEEAFSAAGRREELHISDVAIEAVDARTLRVTLEKPHPGFAELAATTPFRPVPEHVVTAKRDQWTHPGSLVTCGAFGVEKWNRQGLILTRLLAGEGVATLSLLASDLPAEVWPLYERGTVDWIDRSLVPPDKIEALAAAGEIRAAPGPAVMHLRLHPAAKAGLRRAVALGIDRAPIAKKVGPGSEEARTLMGGAEWPARDLAAAVTALAADFPDLKVPKLRLLLWKDPVAEEAARSVREQLESALAVSIRLDVRERVPYRAALLAQEYDLALSSFAPEAGDPAGILDSLQGGRAGGEKSQLDSMLAVPLVREGEWFAAKPRVIAKPGDPLNKVTLKK